MADLSDVTAHLLGMAGAAVYPDGFDNPSVANAPARLFEGWPLASQLEHDLAGRQEVDGAIVENGVGPITNVSVFPMAGAGGQPYQILDAPHVLVPAVRGLRPQLSGQAITLDGAPAPGEFLTVIADGRHAYSRGGETSAEICAALAADARADYQDASSDGAILTIPAQEISLRTGAPVTMGQVTHRQRHTIIISVWAPTPELRRAFAEAIDVALKRTPVITLPDTSQAVVAYDRTIINDSWQAVSVYRRDLYFSVEYATLERWTAYEVTAVNVLAVGGDGPAVPTIVGPSGSQLDLAEQSGQIPCVIP